MADDKRSIYNRSGLGHRIGYGKRPALVVVDMQIGFTAPERSPLAGNLDAQVGAIGRLAFLNPFVRSIGRARWP